MFTILILVIVKEIPFVLLLFFYYYRTEVVVIHAKCTSEISRKQFLWISLFCSYQRIDDVSKRAGETISWRQTDFNRYCLLATGITSDWVCCELLTVQIKMGSFNSKVALKQNQTPVSLLKANSSKMKERKEDGESVGNEEKCSKSDGVSCVPSQGSQTALNDSSKSERSQSQSKSVQLVKRNLNVPSYKWLASPQITQDEETMMNESVASNRAPSPSSFRKNKGKSIRFQPLFTSYPSGPSVQGTRQETHPDSTGEHRTTPNGSVSLSNEKVVRNKGPSGVNTSAITLSKSVGFGMDMSCPKFERRNVSDGTEEITGQSIWIRWNRFHVKTQCCRKYIFV